MHHRLRPLDVHNCIVVGRARTFRWMLVDYVVEDDPYGLEIEAMDALRPGDVAVHSSDASWTNAPWGELMSTIAKHTSADVSVVALIGERGREVQEFITEYLGEMGLKRAIVVVATSDEAALMRRQAAYLTLTLAEYFRDQGKRVLCMMDSLTRFAMAQREIGLAIGEPPTAKGYPPTVFTELPRLLERAGPGLVNSGSVTGLFTVLVEGDDHNEPIADAVRGILDGHIVMERGIAERGRYPAVNVLRSISRTMPGCVPVPVRPTLQKAREFMSVFADMEELIRLGAYRKGSDPQVDRAIALYPALEAFLGQQREERTSIADGYTMLEAILAKA